MLPKKLAIIFEERSNEHWKQWSKTSMSNSGGTSFGSKYQNNHSNMILLQFLSIHYQFVAISVWILLWRWWKFAKNQSQQLKLLQDHKFVSTTFAPAGTFLHTLMQSTVKHRTMIDVLYLYNKIIPSRNRTVLWSVRRWFFPQFERKSCNHKHYCLPVYWVTLNMDLWRSISVTEWVYRCVWNTVIFLLYFKTAKTKSMFTVILIRLRMKCVWYKFNSELRAGNYKSGRL